MDEAQLDDLKQFIAGIVSQTEVRLQGQITGLRGDVTQLQGGLAQLRDEMADGFSGVGEAIASIHDQMAERDIEVDKRLVALERYFALG
ncbi:MAG TPA: hypothetical protein VLF71_00715 [Candidatus Saccharimonadales bacterium]|nr:hypothetical protein [Candidatus Saccharimonadales bacterium]